MISSRVPFMRALRLTWSIPVEDLVRSAVVELWASTEYLELRGSVTSDGLQLVVWPRAIKHLVVDISVQASVEGISWPPRLQHLTLGGTFNQSITAVVWPASLQELLFEGSFNQPIAGVVWPTSLQKLSFLNFNQPVTGNVWPASLQFLLGGGDFNQPIAETVWPASLQQIFFGKTFNRPITGVECGRPPCNACILGRPSTSV